MKNNNSPVRIRFAPSPTGFLHIGNFRVALFDYLLAKNLGGNFILRIEDTDQKREVPGATEKLIKVLKSFSLDFDEGPHLGGDFGPYIQSQRVNIYQQEVEKLLASGKAYRCFCSEERLASRRAEQEANKEAPRYDRHCRNLSAEESKARAEAGEAFVIRQKMPEEGSITVFDELRGEITFKCADLDDQVLIKSNGVPTYQFANVVDDHLMKITHVTRGDEWLSSFPKNILLYQDFGWTPPRFIHFPLILNKEGGGKLSKRKGDVFVEDYLAKGYLPEALVNFCALLGWHPADDQEILNLTELIERFDYRDIGVSPAVFDLEKLNYYNGYYIRQHDLDSLVELCSPYLKEAGYDLKEANLKAIIALSRDRLKVLSEVALLTHYFFKEPEYDISLLIWKNLSSNQVRENLKELSTVLEEILEVDWTKENLEEIILPYLKEKNHKNGDFLWPWRVALTGEKASPSPFEVASVLGKDKSIARVEVAIFRLDQKSLQ
ncbi:MAG: glutamate--tRNA ligase [Patescibacteria group bacterium]|nr:glutamate--tRNA ligase [Patescibacteria group bacterium]MDD3435358.1 glutamate--tRNA ligase [Patescibacteria group bacterium]